MEMQERLNYLGCFAGYAFEHGIVESDKKWLCDKSKALRRKYADCHSPIMVIHDFSTSDDVLANPKVFGIIFEAMIPHIKEVPIDVVVHKALKVDKALITVELLFNVSEVPGSGGKMTELVQKMLDGGGEPFVIYAVNDTTQEVSASVMDFNSTRFPKIV